MKKKLCILGAALMIFSLVGCGGGKSETGNADGASAEAGEEAAA